MAQDLILLRVAENATSSIPVAVLAPNAEQAQEMAAAIATALQLIVNSVSPLRNLNISHG